MLEKELTIKEMNRLKEKMSKGITLDETLYEAINAAINALENLGCGCGICLAHNNMKCPKVKDK